MKKLKTMVVGFGFMGKTHASTILKSEQMELVAIVDPAMSATSSQAAGNFDTGEIDQSLLEQIRWYRTVEECLEAESIDLAFVCVHTNLHAPIATQTLRKGVHTFIEKPFVLKVEEGKQLIELANQMNVKLGVGHVVRFMPAYEKLQEIYKTNSYGQLNFISLNRYTGVPDWGEWKTRKAETFGSTGGALFDLVIHDIDFLQFMLGLPTGLDAVNLPGALSDYDYICSIWNYENKNVKVKVEGGNIFHSKVPFSASFRASFEDATVVWEACDGRKISVSNDSEVKIIDIADANDGFVEEAEYFARCVQENVFPERCSAESALNTIELCYKHIQ